MKNLFSWVALAMAPGVGAVLFKRLLETFRSPERVFQAKTRELEGVEGIGPKVAAALRRFDWGPQVEKEIRSAEEKGAELITWEDAAYPDALKQIYDPPSLLYVLGSLAERDQRAVAVVGSRSPTVYGQAAAERITRGLSRQGITVVSGLARGIDSISHRSALAAGGRTIGVLGCGIDVVYPPENRELFGEVAAQGAVVSEFPLGTPPDRDHFPIRNRIISGLSLGVAVVEATLRSGSLITARFALEQGRDVYAVPGNVDSPRSAGTNRLIKQGAKLVTQAEDILEEILPRFSAEPPVPPVPPKLSAEEEKVYALLGHQFLHVDEITSQSGLPTAKVAAILLSLELAGHIRQIPGMRFAKISA
ncbi:MAG: DNA-processing protein DprA [Deltaproteobacteria bacterium]|nr:DNA-processing protein DprA [Deltaproteobacteria bacterium]